MEKEKSRIGCFDFFRAYGCLAIILLHVVTAWRDDPTNAHAFYTAGSVRIVFDNAVVPILVRMAVPIYFMMSGVLFLSPERDFSLEKIKRHISKLLIVLGLFGYGMALIELVVRSRNFALSFVWTGFLNLIQEETWSHLWYLYATIGLYLLTPILRAWLEQTDERGMNVTIGIAILLLSVIPTIDSVTGLELTQFGITTPRGALLCYLLGYYLYSIHDRLAKKQSLIIAGIAVGGGLTGIFGILSYQVGHVFIEPYHIWIIFYSSMLFIFFLNNEWVGKLASKGVMKILASSSFLIYIIHPVFINGLYKALHIYPDSFPPIVGELIIWGVVACGSVIGSQIIKRVPWLKKYV